MSRRLIVLSVLVLIAGCSATDERDSLRMLSEDVGPRPFPDLMSRAKKQVQLATEAFYTDQWFDVEDAARALEQTARFLPQATEPPKNLVKKLPQRSEMLKKAARNLREAARSKDVNKVNASLQTLNLKIREFNREP